MPDDLSRRSRETGRLQAFLRRHPPNQADSTAPFVGALARLYWMLVGNVNHDKGGSQQVKTALSSLTRDTQAQSLDYAAAKLGIFGLTKATALDATPIGAFVKYLQTCQSVGEVQARCTALMAIR